MKKSLVMLSAVLALVFCLSVSAAMAAVSSDSCVLQLKRYSKIFTPQLKLRTQVQSSTKSLHAKMTA